MHSTQLFVFALSAASTVKAHMKVTLVNGNAGGSMPAMGIQNDVPRFGVNDKTEVDTTVFGGNPNDPTSSGLGKTEGSGKLSVEGQMATAVQMGGGTMPQVSSTGGVLNGTIQMVTSDGAPNNAQGEVFAVIDTTGQGNFKKAQVLMASTNGVGKKGNVVQRSLFRAYILTLRTLGIRRRATNVGADLQFSLKVPEGTTCTGSNAAMGMSNFCVAKISNNNGAGPFGGSFGFQVLNSAATAGGAGTANTAGTAATGDAATAATGADAAATGKGKKGKQNRRRGADFQA